jgi:hypothetical protein
MTTKEKKVPVGLNIPKNILDTIDERRGRINRSTFTVILLEKALEALPK